MTTLDLVDPSAREMATHVPLYTPEHQTLEAYRRMLLALFEAFAPPGPVPSEQRSIPGPPGAPNVRVLLYRPQSSEASGAAILHVHGGGFIAGTPDMLAPALQGLADDHHALVAAVDYRLAPETPFPGPVDDCTAALAWLAANAGPLGIDPSRIIVMGESAGGGLAAATALVARDRSGPALRAQVLVYPMLDPRTGTPEAPVDNPVTGEFIWTRATNRIGWAAMRGGAAIPAERLGHIGPALAVDLAGLPPTFLVVGALDLFLEEDVAYALRLARAGVPVEAHVYPGGIHGFDAAPGALAERFRADQRAALARFLNG